MNVIAHGVDLVEIARIEKICHDHGDTFLSRVYTAAEREYCLAARPPWPRLAGRWAAKEAVLKVLGTGWRGGIEWTDIEVLPDGWGKPHCLIAGRTADRANELGIAQVLVSISHAGGYAMGSAIGLGPPGSR